MADTYPFRPGAAYGAPPRTAFWVVAPRRRLWLHLLLFALTVFTTLAVGARLSYNYAHNRPAYNVDSDLNPFSGLLADPGRLLAGLPFSATLLAILLAHELGHYLTCRYYGIAATLPYFIPAPTIIGTMGAFIRIRSPIVSRRALFDVGVSGPLVGFLLAVPVLAVGIAGSKAGSAALTPGTIQFGSPLLVLLLEKLFHPAVSAGSIELHPVARAAWVGLFATALNLLPVGQLDGGHIVYALDRNWHGRISRVVVAVLAAPMLALALLWAVGHWIPSLDSGADLLEDYYWHGWFVWALVLFFLGTRHPAVVDPVPLDRGRRRLALAALVVFVLCFIPIPFAAR